MPNDSLIELPDSPAIGPLCERMENLAKDYRTNKDWVENSLRLCGDAGVFRWFAPESIGGMGWNAKDQTRAYLRLAQADLQTTFVITQMMGAVKRIGLSDNSAVADKWIEPLLRGDRFATVGISHLTTSGRHLDRPLIRAKPTADDYVFDGFAPWVTGGAHADVFVVGGVLENGDQLLAAIETDNVGVVAGPGMDLVAMSASCTDKVNFEQVIVPRSMVLAGPEANVTTASGGGSAGGLQTSTLAVGLARAAAKYLVDESQKRGELNEVAGQLMSEVDEMESTLLSAVAGDETCDAGKIRGDANSLVMRTTQAAMTAAKGAGFVEGHLVGRWCRQALFFLVWSCPQPVAQAHLCELAGIADH